MSGPGALRRSTSSDKVFLHTLASRETWTGLLDKILREGADHTVTMLEHKARRFGGPWVMPTATSTAALAASRRRMGLALSGVSYSGGS